MCAHDTSLAGFGDDGHGALLALRPVGVHHAVQKQDVDLRCRARVGSDRIGAHFLFGGGTRLTEDGNCVARHALEGFFDVRMGAVPVGGIPESDAIIAGRVEEIGEAAEAELARLVGTAAHVVGAGTLSQAAQLNLHGPEAHAVGGVFRGGAGEQVVRETVERDRGACRCGGAVSESRRFMRVSFRESWYKGRRQVFDARCQAAGASVEGRRLTAAPQRKRLAALALQAGWAARIPA